MGQIPSKHAQNENTQRNARKNDKILSFEDMLQDYSSYTRVLRQLPYTSFQVKIITQALDAYSFGTHFDLKLHCFSPNDQFLLLVSG